MKKMYIEPQTEQVLLDSEEVVMHFTQPSDVNQPAPARIELDGRRVKAF